MCSVEMSIERWSSVNHGVNEVLIDCQTKVSIKGIDQHSTVDTISTLDLESLHHVTAWNQCYGNINKAPMQQGLIPNLHDCRTPVP